MDLVAVIDKTETLLRQGWTKHTNARDRCDNPVRWTSAKACKYCMVGAILRSSWELDADYSAEHYSLAAAIKVMRALAQVGLHDITTANDKPFQTLDNLITYLHRARDYVTLNPRQFL